MITYSRWSMRRSVQRTSGLATATVLVWSAFATTGVFAQQETVVIGGSGLPEIEINLDILDLLGPAPLLAPNTRPAVSDPEPAGTVERTPLEPSLPVKPAIAAPSISGPVVTATVAPLKPPPPPSPKPVLQIAPKAVAPDPAVADAPAPKKSEAVATPAPPPEPPGTKPSVDPTTVAASTPTATNTPEPAAEPVAEPETEDATKVAALPADDSGDAKVGGPIRIEFHGDSTRLPEKSWNDLRVFARKLQRSGSLRVQVKAFAGNSSISESSARRLSLSRALAVRAFLIERGIRGTRIDVRAMGKHSEGGPSERVDVVLVDR